MITRKIGKLFRGKTTPYQVIAACALGSMMGFVPGFTQGPGLMLTLLLLLVVLNANLFLAAMVGALAKLASLALLPVSYMAGRALLDGPTRPFFEWIINTPGLALFGFEHYATTGGVVVGLLFGVVVGLLIVRLVRSVRARMASLEENSEAFRVYSNKGWVRALSWVFLGPGHGKQSYAELMQKKIGKPVRPIGVAFAALFVALVFVLLGFLREPIVTSALRRGLERVNGATVDLRSASLSLREGRMTVEGLAMADPNALETDIFRAAKIELAVSTSDLLRKRIAIDRVVVSEATSGERRAVRGVRVGPPPPPAEPPPAHEGEKTLDDYLADAQRWKSRLGQARRWVEAVSGGEDAAGEPTRETLRERLAREAAAKGYARVVASHLIEGAPTLLVRELIAEGVRVSQLEGEALDVRAENLSTNPRLVDGPPRVEVASRSGKIEALVALGAASAQRGANDVRFAVKGLDVDKAAANLRVAGQKPIRGGTMTLSARGGWDAGAIDLPLRVELIDSTIAIPGKGEAIVKHFELLIALRGPIDNPRIGIDDKQLADALIKAGAREMAGRVTEEAEKRLGGRTGEAVDGIRGAVGGLLGGTRADDKKKDEKKDD